MFLQTFGRCPNPLKKLRMNNRVVLNRETVGMKTFLKLISVLGMSIRGIRVDYIVSQRTDFVERNQRSLKF